MRRGGITMRGEMVTYSLPRWRVTQWLADPGPGVSDEVRIALIGELFGSLPVFAAGVVNTVAVAGAVAIPIPPRPFLPPLFPPPPLSPPPLPPPLFSPPPPHAP